MNAGWLVGDEVHVGSVRWIIRSVSGEEVELEALNVPAGIWWRTTMENLPVKDVVPAAVKGNTMSSSSRVTPAAEATQ